MKLIVIIGALVVIGAGALLLLPKDTPAPSQAVTTETPASTITTTEAPTQDTSAEARIVPDGAYTVIAEQSIVTWAGKKPLIDGYINTGTIGLTEGNITVASTTATGNFIIDMNTLSVSDTPTKPGQESAFEGHLKGERWFNVEGFPTASFEIVEVTPQADSDTTFTYTIRGNLTMKGQTNEISFPAQIYLDPENLLRAEASFEIDRTKWGITAGSGSFFDNLADNVIDDMVGLSFSLVAQGNTI